MPIKKANLKRLASLSALGAGALASAGEAQASGIVYSGILDEHVGFNRGSMRNAMLIGPNSVALLFHDSFQTGPQHSANYWVSLRNRSGTHGTRMRFLGGHEGPPVYRNAVSAFQNGAQWGTANAGRKMLRSGIVGIYLYTYGQIRGTKFTNFVDDSYLLFEFTGGNLAKPLYGWAQLDVTFNKRFPRSPAVTLVDWAYDTSGAPLPAGDTGTPEPSTLALTGLAALALGAKGLRAWRQARSTPNPA